MYEKNHHICLSDYFPNTPVFPAVGNHEVGRNAIKMLQLGNLI